MKKLLILTVIVAVAWLAFQESKSRPTLSMERSIPVTSKEIPAPAPAPAQSPQAFVVKTVNSAETKEVEIKAGQMESELRESLKEIKDRRLVEIINSPRSHQNEKEDALKYMQSYLKKVTQYLKLRSELMQKQMGASHG